VNGVLCTGRDERVVPRVFAENGSKLISTHIKVKGHDAALVPELLKFRASDPSFLSDPESHEMKMYSSMRDYFERKVGSQTYRVPYLNALACIKKLDSGPGEPWSSRYSQFSDLVARLTGELGSEESAYKELADYCQNVEDYILDGGHVDFTYYVHSKEDKYAPKKILTEAYRSIQACDWVFWAICQKWCGCFCAKFKEVMPEIAVKASCYEWTKKIGDPMSKVHTYATDITAFDRCVSPGMIHLFVDYLKETCDLPPLLAKHLFETIAFGDCVMPNGVVVPKHGGNPSGMPFTTEMNCLVNLWMATSVYTELLGMEPDYEKFLIQFMIRVCGDDQLLGGAADKLRVVSELAPRGYEKWGFVVKDERWLNKGVPDPVWEPGVHAPFLDCTTMKVSGVMVDVPLRPYRRLTSLRYDPEGCTMAEIKRGVAESVKGWILAYHDGRNVPMAIEQLVRDMEREGILRTRASMLSNYVMVGA
jgi:hypothetical protein